MNVCDKDTGRVIEALDSLDSKLMSDVVPFLRPVSARAKHPAPLSPKISSTISKSVVFYTRSNSFKSYRIVYLYAFNLSSESQHLHLSNKFLLTNLGPDLSCDV